MVNFKRQNSLQLHPGNNESDSIEREMVNSAIGASLSENTGVDLKEYVIVKQCISRYSILFNIQGTSQSPLEEVLHQLNKNASYEMILSIEVRRSFLVKDAMKEASKSKFNPSKKLKVIHYYIGV